MYIERNRRGGGKGEERERERGRKRGEREGEKQNFFTTGLFPIRTFLKYCIDGQNRNYKVQTLWPI